LLDLIVGNACIIERKLGRTHAHNVVGLAGAWFGEGGHTHANDVNCAVLNGHAFALRGYDASEVSSFNTHLPIANHLQMIG
jgi:hypothetical protein